MIFFLVPTLLLAQEKPSSELVTVYMDEEVSSASIYRGYILEETSGDTLHLKLRSTRIIKIPFNHILSIATKKGRQSDDELPMAGIIPSRDNSRSESEYSFKEKGFYAVLQHDASFTTGGFFDAYPGIELTVGHKFNRHIALGVGGGMRIWTYDVFPENTFQLHTELRGFLFEKNITPYYRLQFGYGNAVNGEFQDFESSDGGIFIGVGGGVRLLDDSRLKLNIEGGYRHQRLTYYNLDFGSFERDYRFNRMYLGISVML